MKKNSPETFFQASKELNEAWLDFVRVAILPIIEPCLKFLLRIIKFWERREE